MIVRRYLSNLFRDCYQIIDGIPQENIVSRFGRHDETHKSFAEWIYLFFYLIEFPNEKYNELPWNVSAFKTIDDVIERYSKYTPSTVPGMIHMRLNQLYIADHHDKDQILMYFKDIIRITDSYERCQQLKPENELTQ
jgi:hypothetical protein